MIKLEDLSGAETFEGVEKKSALRTIQVVVFLGLAGMLLTALNELIARRFDSAIWLMAGAAFLVIPFWLVRRGHLQPAGLILLSIFLVVITYVLHNEQGIHNVDIAAYPILLLVASLVLKRRGFIIVTMLTILATGLLAGGEYWAWFSYPAATPQVLLIDWINLAIIISIVAIGAGLLVHDSRQSLRQTHQEIFERRQIEKALKRSEARYRAMVENSSDAITLTDLEGKVIVCNQQMAVMHGYERAELLTGMNVNDFLAPEEGARAIENMQRTIQAGAMRKIDYVFVNRKGDRFSGELSSSVVTGDNGRPIALIAIARDISERKHIEKALMDSEEKFRRIADNFSMGLFIHQDGLVTYMGRQGAHLMGYEPEEVLGRPILDFIHPEERLRADNISRLRLSGGNAPDHYETRLLKKDGTAFEVLLYSTLIEYEGKAATQGAFFDITERKRVERAIRESEQRYSDMIHGLRDGFCMVDTDGKITRCNPAFEKIVGYTQEELKQVSFIMLTVEKWRKLEARIFLDQALTRGYTDLYEKEYFRKDGSIVPVEVTVYLVRDSLGSAAGFMSFVRDIAERKHTEEALRESEKKFHRIIDQSLDAIVLADEEGRIIEWNRGAEQIMGLKREEALGRPVWEVQFQILPILKQTPEARENIRAHVLDVLKGGQTSALNEVHEIEIQHPDGLNRMIQPATFKMSTTHGHMIGTIIRDISERKRTDEELRRVSAKLQAQLQEIQKLHSNLREQAVRDPLTGLFNRRYLAEVLEHEMARAKREGYPISFVMADIDDFKHLNDTYGHPVGDLKLQDLAVQLKAQTRASDFLFRIGGDEFLMVLVNTTTESAMQCAERSRLSFQATRLNIANVEVISTLSLGIATCPMHGKLSKEILAASDQALYMAKTGGGNRIAVWQPVKES